MGGKACSEAFEERPTVSSTGSSRARLLQLDKPIVIDTDLYHVGHVSVVARCVQNSVSARANSRAFEPSQSEVAQNVGCRVDATLQIDEAPNSGINEQTLLGVRREKPGSDLVQ